MKVLVVDDEKLVRAGFIALMPWDKFGMQVVGEAANGERALHFLEDNEVDLVITDLAMPVLSGIELMRIMKEKHPDIYVVVLSFHQDFELVQDALRLGAIDYIAKVQLEKEKMEDVLDRIRTRIETDRQRSGSQTISLVLSETLIAYYAGPVSEAAISPPFSAPIPGYEIDDGIWCVSAAQGDSGEASAAALQQALGTDWVVVGFRQEGSMDKERLGKAARKYYKGSFFYLPAPGERMHRLTLDEFAAEAPAERALETALQLKKQWTDLHWLRDDDVYARLLQETRNAELPAARVREMLTEAIHGLKAFGAETAARLEPEQGAMTVWSGCVETMDRIREAYRAIFLKSAYSPEVVESVEKAIRYMDEHLEEDLSLVDIAKVVNLSRSYFSQCFRDIAGKPFIDCLREMRMERAKLLLERTDKPVYWVAEKCGYIDEKYFSKVFRARYELLPREYRLKYAAGGGKSSDR